MFNRISSFKPMLWALFFSLVLLLLPAVFSSGASLNLISQVGIAAVFALSFNMLLGQTGMLSFGHAVYSGLGGFVAVHAMNKISDGSLNFPTSLIPLIGGLAGALFGCVFGWIASKKSGITFSMISLFSLLDFLNSDYRFSTIHSFSYNLVLAFRYYYCECLYFFSKN